jgi:uncharacterized repeat protein (TIGR02543 family)
MKSKAVLLMVIAGFLLITACTNPIIEEFFRTGKTKPIIPTTETPDPPAVSHTVAFDSRGGSLVDCQSVAEGEKATRPENPKRDGYGFVNWCNCEELSEPYYDFGTPVTDDITLYAKWSETFYTVTFDSKGGSPVDSQSVAEGGKATRPKNPEKRGFGFVNWYDNGECAGDCYDFETPVTDDIDLYAGWNETFYKIGRAHV